MSLALWLRLWAALGTHRFDIDVVWGREGAIPGSSRRSPGWPTGERARQLAGSS